MKFILNRQTIKKMTFVIASLYLVVWSGAPNVYALMPAADKMNFKYGGGFYSSYCAPSSTQNSAASDNLKDGMWVTGTVYEGKNGAYAADLANQPASFAELKGANGTDGVQNKQEDNVWGTGLGNLPAHTKLMIAYNNKYVIAEKLDIGDGKYTHDEMKDSDFVGDKMPGHTNTDIPRLVDLYLPTTGKMLGVTGTVPVFIKLVDSSTPSTPANGSAANFEGTTSSTATPDTSTTTAATTSSADIATSKRTIVLDPGHAGVNSRNDKLLDPETKLYIGESNNGQENQDAWDVAQTVKRGLEKDGYTVILTKDSAYDKNVTLKSRAEVANNAKADLAVSIHTSSGDFDAGKVNTVTPQTVDKSLDYRVNTDGDKIHFKSLLSDAAAVAEKSLEYANKIVEARNANGSSGAHIGYLNFNGRGSKKAPMSQGRMSITQLFANVPWVYNEAGQSGLDKAAYAKGLLKGIESAVPITTTTSETTASSTSTDDNGCMTTTFNADASDATLMSLIQAYAWPTPNHKPKSEQTDAYKTAIAKAKAAGKYIGGSNGDDCGGFITRLMQDSGRDPNYGGGGATPTQMAYLKKHTELYKQVSFSDLKFGDIGIFDGHTFMYIGNEVPGFKYPIVEAAYRGDSGEESSAPRNINAGAYDYRSDTLYFRYIGGSNASQNI